MCHSFKKRALLLKAGDDKAEVKRILGNPTSTFAKGSGLRIFWLTPQTTERWAYGNVFDFKDCFHKEFPYFIPFRIRLFGPDNDDIAVEFDDNGKVRKVVIPESK